MRVVFNGQLGGAGDPLVFQGYPYHNLKGGGIGSMLRSLFRMVLPIAKQAGKTIGREALLTGANVAQDVLEGETVTTALEKHGKEGAKRLVKKGATKALEKLQSGGSLGRLPHKRIINGRIMRKRRNKRLRRKQVDVFGPYVK